MLKKLVQISALYFDGRKVGYREKRQKTIDGYYIIYIIISAIYNPPNPPNIKSKLCPPSTPTYKMGLM